MTMRLFAEPFHKQAQRNDEQTCAQRTNKPNYRITENISFFSHDRFSALLMSFRHTRQQIVLKACCVHPGSELHHVRNARDFELV